MSKIVNGIKFVTIDELRIQLNKYITENHMYEPNKSGIPATYTSIDILEAYADTREKVFMRTGKKVQEGVHYIKGEPGEHLLSLEGIRLIDKYGCYGGHTAPMIEEGAELLFK